MTLLAAAETTSAVPLTVDWTTILLALITGIVSLGMPFATYWAVKVKEEVIKSNKLGEENKALIDATHTAANSNYKELKQDNKALLDTVAELNQTILQLSIGKATSDEKANPTAPAPAPAKEVASTELGHPIAVGDKVATPAEVESEVTGIIIKPPPKPA